MKNHKMTIFTDVTLTFCICIISSLLFFTSVKASRYLKYLLCLLFSLSVSGILLVYKLNKYKRYLTKQKEKKELENLLANLELMPDNEVIDLLFNFLSTYEIKVEKKENYLRNKNVVYLFNFEIQTSRGRFLHTIKPFIKNNIVFFCNKLSDECNPTLSALKKKVKIVNGELLFSLMKEANFSLPRQEEIKIDKKTVIMGKLNKILTKKRAITFAFLSATLLLFSSFTFYPLYYRICSLILLLLCAVCLIFGKKESIEKGNPLVFED